MKHILKIHRNPVYVEVVMRGKVNPEDIANVMDKVLAHPDFDADLPFLHDFRDIDVAHLAVRDVETIARDVARQKQAFGRARWAVVLSNDVTFGLVRMWNAFIEDRVDFVAEAFRDLDVALDWLLGSDAKGARGKRKSS